MKSRISLMLGLLMLYNMAFADAIQDKFQSVLNSKINGQTASFSKDDRIRVLLGCERYTYTLSATLSNPVVLKTEGSLEEGFTIKAKANYNGLHVADRWDIPCVQKGTDKKSLSGTVTFTITRPSAFAQTNLVINQISNDSLKYTGHVVETAVRRTFSF